MNRTATVLAAVVAALLLTASPAAAGGATMPDPAPAPSLSPAEPFPGEPRPLPSLPPGLVEVTPLEEYPCVGEPFEVEPGMWDCVIEDVPPVDDPAPEEPAPDVEPPAEPEPVDIVEDNGGWGWSDAREAYSL